MHTLRTRPAARRRRRDLRQQRQFHVEKSQVERRVVNDQLAAGDERRTAPSAISANLGALSSRSRVMPCTARAPCIDIAFRIQVVMELPAGGRVD